MGTARISTRCTLAAVAIAGLSASCGGGGGYGGGSPSPVTFHASAGIAEKGPLILGSAVTAQELDASLSPTGKQYSYQISSDLGAFSPTSDFTSRYIGATATGYYFDEALGTVSTGTVTLNSYSDLSLDTVMNVNILTTLAYQRIRTLVGSGKTFAAARAQAEQEVLTALKIPAGAYGSFGALTLGGNNDGAQILAAISSLFVQGNDAGEVSVLINNLQSDLGLDGTLDNAATILALDQAAVSLDPAAIAQHLNQRFSTAGVSFEASDIARWLDRNGDGVVGDYHFEVADAGASTSLTLPAQAVAALNGRSIYMDGGGLSVNGVTVTGTVTLHAGDVVELTPGSFDHGMANAWISSGPYAGVIRVSFLAPVNSIEVSQPARPFIVGEQQAFTATAHFQDGSSGDVSSFIRWQSSAPEVATVDGAGLAAALAVGTSMISASFGDYSGSSDMTVVAVRLDAFSISPSALATGIGVAQRPIATGLYSDGSTRDITDLVTWSNDDSQVASVVAATGVISGVAPGSTVVEGRIGSMVDSVTVNVTAHGVSVARPVVVPRRGHSATVLANGKLLIAGGESTETTAELYDPATATWSSAGSMDNRHGGGHRATLLSDGRVFVTGGAGSGPAVPFAELYDPASNGWSSATQMTLSRISHTATTLLDGTVLVVGGNGGLGPIYDSVVLYDPAANSWSARASVNTPRANHTATRLANGKVLVAGGWEVIGSAAESVITATTELYDPEADTWTPLASMSHARINHTATLLPDGRILVVGGSNMTDMLPPEIYDPDSNSWSTAGTMTNLRIWHTAVLRADGTVMVAGGYVGAMQGAPAVSTDSVEAYDPATNSWSPLANLNVPRSFHSATLLGNNAVLFVGGGNEAAPYMLNSTELHW